jgi:hypothetical protein
MKHAARLQSEKRIPGPWTGSRRKVFVTTVSLSCELTDARCAPLPMSKIHSIKHTAKLNTRRCFYCRLSPVKRPNGVVHVVEGSCLTDTASGKSSCSAQLTVLGVHAIPITLLSGEKPKEMMRYL